MLRVRYLLWGCVWWLVGLAAHASNDIAKIAFLPQQALIDDGVPAQVDGASFISLNAIISHRPFRARVNYVGDESLAMELMFALNDASTGKVIWLEQRRTSQYMFEISHASVTFDDKRHQLQAYQVIRPILLSELTPKIEASKRQSAVQSSAGNDVLSNNSTPSQEQCSLARTNGETFWQMAKQYAREAKLNIYDSVVSLFYSNPTAFTGANIEQLRATRLRCPSAQQVQWWQQRGDSHKIYRQLLQGASYSEVIDLNDIPK